MSCLRYSGSVCCISAEYFSEKSRCLALLYCVALHRFLAARLAGYDPGRHLGGVLYLFVRGMGGAATGAATGVFAWQPPVPLIVELSQILGGGRHD